MKKPKIVYKPRPLDKILFTRLIELRNSLRLTPSSIIPYSKVREKLCRNFSINKNQLKEVIEYLLYSGFIENNQRGIKLNFEIEDES